MNQIDEQLLSELRHLNAQLAALRQVAEGPMLAELMEVFVDLRQVFASLAGFRVKTASRPRPMPEVNPDVWGIETSSAKGSAGVAETGVGRVEK